MPQETLKSPQFYKRLKAFKLVFAGLSFSLAVLCFAGSLYHTIDASNLENQNEKILSLYSDSEEFDSKIKSQAEEKGWSYTLNDAQNKNYIIDSLKQTKTNGKLKETYLSNESKQKKSENVSVGLMLGVITSAAVGAVATIDACSKDKNVEKE